MSEREYLWKRRHEVLYGIRLSSLYHHKRERFLDALDRIAKAFFIFGGSAALANVDRIIVFGFSVAKWAAAFIVLISTLALAFDVSRRARDHANLARRFVGLEGDIVSAGERAFTEKDVARWESELAKIEADEPPQVNGLVSLCQVEMNRVLGKPATVGWWRRITANFR